MEIFQNLADEKGSETQLNVPQRNVSLEERRWRGDENRRIQMSRCMQWLLAAAVPPKDGGERGGVKGRNLQNLIHSGQSQPHVAV
jgi:hypothetical protein